MKVHELINSPEKWCQHHAVLDSQGNGVISSDPKAVRFCIMGGIARVYGHSTAQNREAYDKLFSSEEMAGYHYGGGISFYNDTHTFEEIHALLVKYDI